MTDNDIGAEKAPSSPEQQVDAWDPALTKQVLSTFGAIVDRYFRAEVRDIDSIPSEGGALLVSNHSGGMFTPDVLVLSSAFYRSFGYLRPLYTLAHSFVLLGPVGRLLRRLGVIEAGRDAAAHALQMGTPVLVFPGGDYDSYRPTSQSSVIDFNGRTGYVRVALEAGVPIVPVVSVGAQETQLFLTRGTRLAKLIGLDRQRLGILPISVGFPFGLTAMFPPNVPLPSKIVTRVLEPIVVVERFGDDPDVDEVDAHVRAVMQSALNELADQRRLPIIG
jgi:1-acyl-sn-glycerol-3-phosphate acyltransferase